MSTIHTPKIKFVRLTATAAMPEKQTVGASGYDLRADLPNGSMVIAPGHTRLVPTGLSWDPGDTFYVSALVNGLSCLLAANLEMQIRARSGLAYKQGITVLNGPGTIDADYRGQIGVLLHNTSLNSYEVNHGDRIAQAVFSIVHQVNLVEADSLDDTVRGQGGFGHTGAN